MPTQTVLSPEPKPNRHKPRKNFKKSQRRKEIDELKRKYSVEAQDPETFRIMLAPSDPDFILPIAALDFDLHIPIHYPKGNPVKISIKNSDIPRGYALNVEQGFSRFTGTLMERIKELDSELESFLTLPPQATFKIVKVHRGMGRRQFYEEPEPAVPQSPQSDSDSEHSVYLTGSGSGSGSEYSDSDDSDSDEDEDDSNIVQSSTTSGPKPRGTELVLNVQLVQIALLELQSLNVLLKCGRCKFHNEFFNLNSAPYGDEARPRSISCEKCSLPLAVGFRKEFIHGFSNCGGFLDIAGGTLSDMLPSSFVGVCQECTDATFPFKLVDFGKTVSHTCRKCHTKQSLTIESFRFDIISTGTATADSSVKSNQQEKLKIKGGEPLPDDGLCKHYRKSQRWFRFGCCKRVFPCDRCHDEETGHKSDPAVRMICGKCSKEQHFTPECRYCHHIFTVRKTGFWEGGKGTRDPKKMSRKDPRKYKRRNRAKK